MVAVVSRLVVLGPQIGPIASKGLLSESMDLSCGFIVGVPSTLRGRSRRGIECGQERRIKAQRQFYRRYRILLPRGICYFTTAKFSCSDQLAPLPQHPIPRLRLLWPWLPLHPGAAAWLLLLWFPLPSPCKPEDSPVSSACSADMPLSGSISRYRETAAKLSLAVSLFSWASTITTRRLEEMIHCCKYFSTLIIRPWLMAFCLRHSLKPWCRQAPWGPGSPSQHSGKASDIALTGDSTHPGWSDETS